MHLFDSESETFAGWHPLKIRHFSEGYYVFLLLAKCRLTWPFLVFIREHFRFFLPQTSSCAEESEVTNGSIDVGT